MGEPATTSSDASVSEMLTTADKLFVAGIAIFLVGSVLYVSAASLGIDRIPGEFWGVVVGSLFTILGVTLSNKANRDGQARQFEHEHRVKSWERIQAIRRDVYMDAAVAFQAGVVMLARMIDPDVSDEDAGADWQKRAPGIAKVGLVSDLATFELVQAYHADFAICLTQLTMMRLGIRRRQTELAALRADPSALKEGVKARDSQVREMEQELAKRRDTLARVAVEAVGRLAKAQASLVAAARLELEVPTDAEALSAIVARTSTHMVGVLHGVLDGKIPAIPGVGLSGGPASKSPLSG